jgi:amidase
MTSARHTFDVLRATAADLRTLLDAGNITSVEIVQAYLAQIARHNHDGLKLNAVISTAPESFLLEEARALDLERQKSGPRSRLHGIPILLKVKHIFVFEVLLIHVGSILYSFI